MPPQKKSITIKTTYKYYPDIKYLFIKIDNFQNFMFPVPFKNDFIFRVLAVLSAFTTITSLNISKDLTWNITFHFPFSLPPQLHEMFDYFSQQQDMFNLKVVPNIMDKNESYGLLSDNLLPDTSYGVILYSGGKDSIFQYLRFKGILKMGNYSYEFPAEWLGTDNNIPELYELKCIYISGSFFNPQYILEIPYINNFKRRFNIPIKIIHLEHCYMGKYAHFNKFRIIWRDLLLITIARLYGGTIGTGITYEELLHKEKYNSEKNISYWTHFSESRFVIETLASLLKSKIFILPEEFDVYRIMYNHFPDYFNNSLYCINPFERCNPEKNWKESCIKCKTRSIYNAIISGHKLTSNQLEYLKSETWFGSNNFKKKILRKYTAK